MITVLATIFTSQHNAHVCFQINDLIASLTMAAAIRGHAGIMRLLRSRAMLSYQDRKQHGRPMQLSRVSIRINRRLGDIGMVTSVMKLSVWLVV